MLDEEGTIGLSGGTGEGTAGIPPVCTRHNGLIDAAEVAIRDGALSG